MAANKICVHACMHALEYPSFPLEALPLGIWENLTTFSHFSLLFPSYRYSFLTFFALWGLASKSMIGQMLLQQIQ